MKRASARGTLSTGGTVAELAGKRPAPARPARQKTRTPEKRDSGREEKDKASFYLDRDVLLLLETERQRRLAAGETRRSAQVSVLVGEAIRKAYGGRPA